MDAVRLIVTSRLALAGSEDGPRVMTEAWQAYALAQAIGSRLAVSGPPELRGEALGLTELAGRGCGTIRTGRHIRYPKDTPLNNLWLSLLDRMQVKVPALGDSTGRLAGLEA